MASRWIAVWARAVVMPASRRSDPATVGCALVASLIFGPTAMHPSDLTGLALHDPGVGAVLAAIWLLIFVPTARMLVRPAGAAYLASLAGWPRTAQLATALALIVLQLPWLLLWVWGEGLLGLAIVLATTLVMVALAYVSPPRLFQRPPVWRSGAGALVGVQLRALWRRGGDALVRGAGLAVLAGLAGGLMARNNQLGGEDAGVVGAAVIAVVIVPAQIGPALVILAAHRDAAWIAQAFGIAPRARTAALVATVAGVHLGAAAIATAAAMLVAGATPWLPVLALGAGLGTALVEARTILAHSASPSVAVRVVISAIAGAALAVVCLSVLDASGVLAILAAGTLALLSVKP